MSVVKALRCLGNARTCSVIFQLLWRAARHDRGKEGRRAPSGESMSFRPKNAAGVRSGEISRATLQIHFHRSLSVVKALRCLGDARTCSVIFQPYWRAARHDKGEGGGARPRERVCHFDRRTPQAFAAEKSPGLRFRYTFTSTRRICAAYRGRLSGGHIEPRTGHIGLPQATYRPQRRH